MPLQRETQSIRNSPRCGGISNTMIFSQKLPFTITTGAWLSSRTIFPGPFSRSPLFSCLGIETHKSSGAMTTQIRSWLILDSQRSSGRAGRAPETSLGRIHTHPWSASPQPEERLARDSAQRADRVHRADEPGGVRVPPLRGRLAAVLEHRATRSLYTTGFTTP